MGACPRRQCTPCTGAPCDSSVGALRTDARRRTVRRCFSDAVSAPPFFSPWPGRNQPMSWGCVFSVELFVVVSVLVDFVVAAVARVVVVVVVAVVGFGNSVVVAVGHLAADGSVFVVEELLLP